MDSAVDRVIGAQLKHLRKSQSVTQREVACRLQVTQSYVSLLEAGKRRLHFSEFFGYSSAIQLSPECVYLNVREALENNRDTKHLVHRAPSTRREHEA